MTPTTVSVSLFDVAEWSMYCTVHEFVFRGICNTDMIWGVFGGQDENSTHRSFHSQEMSVWITGWIFLKLSTLISFTSYMISLSLSHDLSLSLSWSLSSSVTRGGVLRTQKLWPLVGAQGRHRFPVSKPVDVIIYSFACCACRQDFYLPSSSFTLPDSFDYSFLPNCSPSIGHRGRRS